MRSDKAPSYEDVLQRPYRERRLLFEDTFGGDRPEKGWIVRKSKELGTRVPLRWRRRIA